MSELLKFQPNQSTELDDGTFVKIMLEEEDEGGEPDDTELHEAAHAVTARRLGEGVRYVSDVATEKYEGVTETDGVSKVHAIIAAASISQHTGGTGGDERAILASGRDIASAVRDANSIVANSQPEIYAVGRRIHKKATINGAEVDDAMASVHRIDGRRVRADIWRPDGSRETMHDETNSEGIVIFAADRFRHRRPTSGRKAA